MLRDSSSKGTSLGALNTAVVVTLTPQQHDVFRLSKEDIPFADDEEEEVSDTGFKQRSVIQKRVRPEDIAFVGRAAPAPSVSP